MPNIEFTPIIAALLSGLFGVVGTLSGIYYQRRSESQRQLVDKVYSPLYNELAEITEGELPFNASEGRFNSYWNELGRYWQSKIDNDLKERIEEYTEKLEMMDFSFRIIADEIVSDKKMGSVKNSVYSGESSEYIDIQLLFKESHTGSRKSYVPILDWFDAYSTELFESNNMHELEEKIKARADSLGSEHRRAIDSWEDKHLKGLGEAIKKADTEIEYSEEISSTSELIEAVKTDSQELSVEIKKESDSLI